MNINTFEDRGTYYQNMEMIEKEIVLSMGSHLLYDISDVLDVQIIKIYDKKFYDVAWKNTTSDAKDVSGSYFFGEALIFRGVAGRLAWEG